jgi:DNA (cytosine-5)-methyltransferase 1
MPIHGIDLFAGAGGLSLGAQLAGVTVTHAIESHYAAAATYHANHPKTVILNKDIREITAFKRDYSRPLILFGGPPCQGFSTSNQRTRTLDNPKNWLFSEFFRFVRTLKPDRIVLENVTGIRETAQGRFLQLIEREFDREGYACAIWTLNALDFGVPQKRFRLFFVATRHGKLPNPPLPFITPPPTVRDAISDLPKLKPGSLVDRMPYRSIAKSDYARMLRRRLVRCTGHLVSTNNSLVLARYRHVPPGGNWSDIPSRLMQNYTNLVHSRSRHTGIYRRLTWHQPSIVIANYRKNMLIHPSQNRGLSVREAARLQSFPDDYLFAGSIGFQQQQVGNAVPPLLARVVFERVIASLN